MMNSPSDRSNCILGINIGGTTCSVAIGTEAGKIFRHHRWSSEAHLGPQHMINHIVVEGWRLIRAFKGSIARIGVAVGGPMDRNRGLVLSPPNLPGWDQVDLKSILSRSFCLPVKMEHDAAACCLAETLWGHGRGKQRVAYLTCGTGFGVGLVFNGKPYYGAEGMSIELGHVQYRSKGPVKFGKEGCFE
ncbi:MAG: ROK family protein, partial [Lentisphaerae bacterium]